MREVTVMRHSDRPLSTAEAAAVRAEINARFREKQEREAQIRAMARRPMDRNEAASLRFAMRAVEQRIVRGLWVLEISQSADGPRRQAQHGLGYLPEQIDHYGTIASGGKWEQPSPRPAVPSSKEIDAAREAQGWISWLDEEQARLLTVAAMSKRGDRERRVNWDRVTDRLTSLRGTKMRTLQERYDRALRFIVAELTLRRVA